MLNSRVPGAPGHGKVLKPKSQRPTSASSLASPPSPESQDPTKAELEGSLRDHVSLLLPFYRSGVRARESRRLILDHKAGQRSSGTSPPALCGETEQGWALQNFPRKPCHRTVPTQVWKNRRNQKQSAWTCPWKGKKKNRGQQTNKPRKTARWTGLWTGSQTLLATSDICTIRRPLCKIPEIPPTSRSSWPECPSFGSHDFPAYAGGVERSQPGIGAARGVGGALPRCPLSDFPGDSCERGAFTSGLLR